MIMLYVRNGCPYCNKVLQAAKDLPLEEGKDFEVVDAAPGTPGREVVLKVGKKAMVPFLIDGEHSMYESDDIVNYLRNK